MDKKRGRKKITVVHFGLYSWIKRDIEILSTKYDVTEVYAPNIRKPLSFLAIARQVSSSDLVLGWFADYPTLWANLTAKLFHGKSIVIIVGYEVAYEPEINYGRLWRRPWGKHLVRWALKSADKVLAVSHFSRREAIEHLQLKPHEVEVLYHGFPIPDMETELAKEPMALTVGFVRWTNVKTKGLGTFVRSAAYLPHIPFLLIGDWGDDSINYLRTIASPNVEFVQVSPVGPKLLEDYYRKAKVYVQVSLHESFSCSLAEAMLWQCVPAVTECGALPEVVGDAGFYVPPDQPEELASQIALALKSDKGPKARQRIIDKFPLEKREKDLLQLVHQLLEKEKEVDHSQ